MKQTLVGLFDDATAAQRAAKELVDAGFSRQDVRLLDKDSGGGGADLVALSVPQADAERYAQRIGSGSLVVAVTAEDAMARAATEILDRDGASDLDADTAAQGGRLEVVEETLQVGKREVERGGMRVRSFVTERAVSQDVSLREERVDVTRTKVDRPATEADFQAGTIEMRETAEVAVVAKEARVVEEISLGKTASERTETVSGTVRRTDFEVEHVGDAGAVPTDAGLDAEFRTHLKVADPGASYDRYAPAFAYGRRLATDPQGASGWDANAASYRSRWEAKNPGTWGEFQASVRHAFDAARSKASVR